MSTNQSRLVYLHIPKTGGSSLRGVLSRYYPNYLHLDGEDAQRPLMTTLQMKGIAPEQLTSLGGHLPVCLMRGYPIQVDFVTILRDPKERVISDFYYIKRSPQHPLCKEIESGFLSFDRFIAGKYAKDLMARRLYPMSLEDNKVFYYDISNDDLMAGAIQTLRSCKVVGLTEDFNGSVSLIAEAFKWSYIPDIHHHNATLDRPKYSDLNSVEQELILAQTECDQYVYSVAQAIFKTSISSLHTNHMLRK